MPEEAVTLADVKAILRVIAADVEAAKDHLGALDAASGDGDLGVTMVLGARAVTKELDNGDAEDVGAVLLKAGAAFSNAAPSSMGALLGTALIRAGQEVKGRRQVGLPEIARMAQAAERGIRDRGRAELGDKTILDALSPAAAALADCTARNTRLRSALELAQAGAQRGLDATINMKSRLGRAAWLGERTIGNPDAGAACFCLMLRTVVRWFGERLESEPSAVPGASQTRGSI
jgi:dihydroxyacetone kinase-like protein